eukprot:scaffold644_cov357-Pavlova_lutheri.AAC.1
MPKDNPTTHGMEPAVPEGGVSKLSETELKTVLAWREQERGKEMPVVTLDAEDTVEEALKKLAQHKIQSAPVLVGPESVPPRDRMVGFADVTSILGAFIEYRSRVRTVSTAAEWPNPGGRPVDPIQQLRELQESHVTQDFAQTSLKNAISTDGSVVYSAEMNVDLYTILRDGFLDGNRDNSAVQHRLAVFDEQGDIVSVLSQSDVVKFLFHNASGTLRDWLKESVTTLDVGLDRGYVYSIPENVLVLDAFAYMVRHHVSGLPVVQATTGKILGNLSASDVRLLKPEFFGVLALPVIEFLTLLHPASDKNGDVCSSSAGATHPFFSLEQRKWVQSSPHIPLVTCRPTDALEDVVSKLVCHRMHRVYVVDDQSAPVGCITLTDVLRLLVQKEAVPAF